MSETTLEAPGVTETVPAPTPAVAVTPASASPQPLTTRVALARCLEAYRRAYKTAIAKGEHEYHAGKAAAMAYRQFVPSTETNEDVQALIACVAQGINYQVYEGRESTQLLYAAQVALASRKPQKPEKAKPQKAAPEQ